MPFCLVHQVNVHYEIHGEGIPILMIHGFTPDMKLMKGCMEPIFSIRKGFQRIYIDLPGMGKTGHYHHLKNAEEILDIVIGFIDTMIQDQPFLIVGESYGGYLTKGVLAKRGERVRGAAFICPVVVPNASDRTLPPHSIVYKDERFLKQLTMEEREEFSRDLVILNEYSWNRYKNEIKAGCQLADEPFLQKIAKQYSFTFPVTQMMYEFPAIFLLGKQDSVVGYKDALDLIDQFPRATYAIVDEAGHNLQIEQREIFDTLIHDWLNRVTENRMEV
ncbi:alpha/beta hydrolase [Bacillus spongiae]|uniref:Alpha/beta hydrolase n=1 Tax=Bacillus spongiae TaxID=2683610 RepID=A0ABU8HCF0_9BACI